MRLIKLYLVFYLFHCLTIFASDDLIILDNCKNFDKKTSELITPSGMGFLHKGDKNEQDFLFTYQIHNFPTLAIKSGDFVFFFTITKSSSINVIAKIINVIAKPKNHTSIKGFFHQVRCCDEVKCLDDIQDCLNELKKIFPEVIIKISEKDSKLSLGVNKEGDFFLFPALDLLKKMLKENNISKLMEKLKHLGHKRTNDAYYMNENYTRRRYNNKLDSYVKNSIPYMQFEKAPRWWIENYYPVYNAIFCIQCHKAMSKNSECPFFCSDSCYSKAFRTQFCLNLKEGISLKYRQTHSN